MSKAIFTDTKISLRACQNHIDVSGLNPGVYFVKITPSLKAIYTE